MKKEIPITLEYVNESIFAGFGKRLVSLLLDGLIFIPFSLIILYVNSLGINYFYYTLVPNLLVGFWYTVYLVKQNGGTPGKRIMRLKILKMDGGDIGWKEAILRYCISFVFSAFMLIVMAISLGKADESYYLSLSWLKKQEYLQTLSPVLFTIATWTNNIWLYGELIVLLTNKRKRAVHDFVAGTVIVKDEYVDQIREVMALENTV